MARAGTARGWIPARGLGMAAFAIPSMSPPSRKARWVFCTKADTVCSEVATESFCLWITSGPTESALVAALWMVVVRLVVMLVVRFV
jgi:hypothetical protein